jgi:hypothetical protein
MSDAMRDAVQTLAAILPGSTGLLPDQIQGLTPADWDAFDIQEEDDVTIGARFLGVAGQTSATNWS